MREQVRKIKRTISRFKKATQSITRQTWTRFGLEAPSAEVRFHEKRKWRIDFVWYRGDSDRLAVEVNGGVWTRGRHSGGIGQIKDMEKGAALALAGYYRIEVTPRQVESGYAAALVRAWLCGDSNPSLPPDPEQRKRTRK